MPMFHPSRGRAVLGLGLVLAFSGLARAGGDSIVKQYKTLGDPRAQKFVAEALEDAVAFLGKPAVPVRKVYLRLSVPLDPKSNLRRDFQLTELVDADKGIFAIYLSRKPD